MVSVASENPEGNTDGPDVTLEDTRSTMTGSDVKTRKAFREEPEKLSNQPK